MSAMSPDRQRLRDALRRLSGESTVPVIHTAPYWTHERNGGHTVTITAPSRPHYSTRTEAVIVKIARTKARREIWRARMETAVTAGALLAMGVLILLAMLWITQLALETVAVP